MDYNIEEHAKNKDVRGAMVTIICASLMLAVGTYWKDWIWTAVEIYFPSDLGAKAVFGVAFLAAAVILMHFLLKLNGKKPSEVSNG